MGRPKLSKPRYKLYDRGGVWYVGYTDPGTDKYVRASTGCRSREEAQAWLTEFLRGLEEAKEPDVKTVGSILDHYIEDRTDVVEDLPRLLEIKKQLVARMGWIPITDLAPSTSKLYIEQRRGEGVGDGTIRRELGVLTAALNLAAKDRWIRRDDVPHIHRPPAPAPKDRWLNDHELQRLMAAASALPHFKLFLQIYLNTGARQGSILALKWRQVLLDKRLIMFNPTGRRQTAKARVPVKINNSLAEALIKARLGRTCDAVIEWQGKPVLSIKKAFATACRKARIKDASPHVLRHTVATRLAMAGEPMEKIQRLLGHRDLATTVRVYAHWHPDYLQSTVDALE